MDERSRRIAHRLEIPMLVAALLVIPVIVIEQTKTSHAVHTAAEVGNWAIWLAFLAELVVMLAVVPEKGRWLRDHPLEVLIVVATPPFFASAFSGLRILRLLRLIRLLRLAKVMRTMFSLEGLRYASLLALVTALGGGAAFSSLEPRQSLGDGVYWAVTTMTTVGYGDPHPTTSTSKVLAVVIMLVGIGFVAVLTAAIAERFLAATVREEAAEVEQDVEMAEEDVIEEIRDLGARLRRTEAALVRAGHRPT